MIIEIMLCEKCGGEVGSLKGNYLCKKCGHLLSDERIQELLTQVFEKHEKKQMKGYRVFTQDTMGYESKALYTTDYHIAAKEFNKLLQLTIKNNDVITDKDDFGEIKTEFKEYEMLAEEKSEIICMKAPYIIYRKGKALIGSVFYGYESGYEYREYELGSKEVVIEEIKILQ